MEIKGLEIKENDIKLAVAEYLQLLANQGELYADRLNSGEVIVLRGNTRRRVKLCRPGTADFFVIQKRGYFFERRARIIFLETKSTKGKQSEAQKEFQGMVERQGAEYHLVRSVEDLLEVLEGGKP